MSFLGLPIEVKNKPVLDTGFVPFSAIRRYYAAYAKREAFVSVRRSEREVAVERVTLLESEGDSPANVCTANLMMLERTIKLLLWVKGGYEVGLYGCGEYAEELCRIYSPSGARAFDVEFMTNVYRTPFRMLVAPVSALPQPSDDGFALGNGCEGCRIGLDVGGSARKAAALVDGKVVFEERIPWQPKLNSDPQYHYDGIMDSLRRAAAHLPRVDAIGVSSAGIFVQGQCRVSSLFIKVPADAFEVRAKNIFLDAAKELNAPVAVFNDGDVAALAGVLATGKANMLGISMGTAEAGGYVDAKYRVKGWLNELAFAPVDVQQLDGRFGAVLAEPSDELPLYAVDEWSGDAGVGCKYFSQDAVIRLALSAGMQFPQGCVSPADRFGLVHDRLLNGDGRERSIARDVFLTIGSYLGHAAALYYDFYKMDVIMLMGGVVSGAGGELICGEARRVLAEEYPDVRVELLLQAPELCALGQAVVAAGLAKL